MFIKKCEKIIECKKKGNCNLAYKQGLFLKNLKSQTSFKDV